MGDQPGSPRSVLADLPPLQLCASRVVDAISKTILPISPSSFDPVLTSIALVHSRFRIAFVHLRFCVRPVFSWFSPVKHAPLIGTQITNAQASFEALLATHQKRSSVVAGILPPGLHGKFRARTCEGFRLAGMTFNK